MTPRRKRGPVIGPVWYHVATLLGLLLAGGGLLLGVYGLVVREQEAQRALNGHIFKRVVVAKYSSADDVDTNKPNLSDPPPETPQWFNYKYGYTTQVHWVYIVAGLWAFVVGGYLVVLGALGMNRQWSEGRTPLSGPVPEWIESLEGRGDATKPEALADRPRE